MPPGSIVAEVRDLGVESAGVLDLAAIAFSRRIEDVDAARDKIRQELGGSPTPQRLMQLSLYEIQPIIAFDDFEWLRYRAVAELGRRLGAQRRGEVTTIKSSEEALELFTEQEMTQAQECFWAILLNAKSQLIRKVLIHQGTLTQSVVGAREVFAPAITERASSIIVLHNHPSGDPSPSPEDISVTRKLMRVGEMLDIPVLDHIIIGHPDNEPPFLSLNRRGFL
ncbi:MAG: RadC family protein [Fimbriimonadaceae bacterium]